MATLMEYAKRQLEAVEKQLEEKTREKINCEIRISGLLDQQADLIAYIEALEKNDNAQNAHALADTVTSFEILDVLP